MPEQQSRLAIIIDSTGAQRNAEGLSGALNKMTQAGQRAADGAGKVSKATSDESKALSDLLDKIDPVNAALNRLDDQQRQLSKYQAKGFIDTETFADYSKKIEQTRAGLNTYATEAGKAGMSSKQLAANMRMVPAQMTDIVVSLASGQAPLTVLLQQGGQLKDMFGGITPAAKALGTYIYGLVNPFTVAAAAAAALTYAIYSNRQELESAKTLAKDSLGATGEYADRLSLNMIAISNSTGKAVEEVASMFITTNDGASEAINKLIDVGYGYDDARQMVDSYKSSANFTALNREIDEHQREILKIGNSWTSAAINAKNYYTGANLGKQSVALGGAIDPAMRFIQQALDLQGTMNNLRIEGNKQIALSVDWINKEYLMTDRVAGAEENLKLAREQAKKIASSGDKEAISNANKLIEARQKEVEEAKKSRDKQPKEKAYRDDAGDRLLLQLKEQNAALAMQESTGYRIGSQQQALIKWEQQLSDLKSKGTLTADQKSLLANADILTKQYQQNAALERQIETAQKALALERARADINRTIANRMSQYSTDEMFAGGGFSQYEQQQYTQRLSLEQSYNDKISQLRQQRASATTEIAREEIDQEIQLQQQALQTELSNYDAHMQRMNDLRGNFTAGAKRAWQEYQDSAANVSAMSQQLFSNAFSGMEDALVKFVTTGKASFSDFANSVLADIARIAIRQSLVGIGSSFAGGFGGLFASGAAASVKANAKGGVYDSPSLSAYSGGVYDSPQFFAFAKGAGVFGEAGPEAIMPLKRGPDGSLGVRMVDGGQSGSARSGDVIIHQTFNMTGNGDAALQRAMEEAARKGATDGAKQARQDMLQDFQNRGQGRRLLGV
ncbi:phage tail tape measure protein [Pantoea allii]|uniref:phage tail tape measure protein n=1 Tax=Pantoea allii TaxID=574096 RepID=UPI003D7A3124